jgi:hypothetical protein
MLTAQPVEKEAGFGYIFGAAHRKYNQNPSFLPQGWVITYYDYNQYVFQVKRILAVLLYFLLN